jgi:hypothetical protein
MTSLFKYFKKFNALSKEAERAIADISGVVTIKKNKDLQPIGHTCKTIYFIKKGVAHIYYFKDGIDITGSSFFENSIIARNKRNCQPFTQIKEKQHKNPALK